MDNPPSINVVIRCLHMTASVSIRQIAVCSQLLRLESCLWED